MGNTMSDNLPPLLPCPFCGRTDLLGFELVERGFTAVACLACGARSGGNRAETNKEAALYWNRRASLEASRAAPQPVAQPGEAMPAVPDGRLHDDGYFTWNHKKHPNGQRPVQLPRDFWLSAAQVTQAKPEQAAQPLKHAREQRIALNSARLAPVTGCTVINSAAYIELYEAASPKPKD